MRKSKDTIYVHFPNVGSIKFFFLMKNRENRFGLKIYVFMYIKKLAKNNDCVNGYVMGRDRNKQKKNSLVRVEMFGNSGNDQSFSLPETSETSSNK